MYEYDPFQPELFGVYKYIQVSNAVRMFTNMHSSLDSDFILKLNHCYVGRLTSTPLGGRVLCQSTVTDGILAVYNVTSQYCLGHLLIHAFVAHAFVPAHISLVVDNTFLYKHGHDHYHHGQTPRAKCPI